MATTIYKFKSDLKGLQQLNAGLKEATKNLAKLKQGTEQYAAASKNVAGMTQTLNNNRTAVNNTTNSVKQLNKTGNRLVSTFKSASVAIVSAFAFRAILSGMRGLVTVFAGFEAKMAAVKAISGATEEEFKALSESAKDLGETTVFTAAQVAELQEELSRLGFDPEEIITMQDAILNLSAATGESLSKSAAIAGAQLNAFGLEAEQTVRVTNTMGAAFSGSALNLERFTQSMKFVAPVAKTAGFTMEETTALLMNLADQGIHGSIAGNALKNVFIRLGDANSDFSKSLDGSVQGLPQLIEEMRKMKEESFGLTEATELLDKRSAPAFLALLESIDQLEDNLDIINLAEGDIERMASIRLDTLEGDFKLLQSATEGLGLAIGENLNLELRKIIFSLTKFVQNLSKSEKALKLIKGIIFAVIGAAAAFIVRLAALRIATIAASAASGRMGIQYKRFLVTMRQAAIGTTMLTRSLQRLRVALASTGIGLLIVAVGTLIGYFMSLIDAQDETNFETMRLKEAFNEQVDAIAKLNKFSTERHDKLRTLNNEYGHLLGNIDLEILSTQELIKLKMLLNNVASMENQLKEQDEYIQSLQETFVEEERLAQQRIETAREMEESGMTLIQNTIQDNNTGFYGEEVTAQFESPVDAAEKDLQQLRDTYEEQIKMAKDTKDAIISNKIDEIEDFARLNDIQLENGETLRMRERLQNLDSLEDFRQMNHAKQESTVQKAEIELADLERAQDMLEVHTAMTKAQQDGNVDLQAKYEGILQKMRDGSSEAQQKFFMDFVNKQGHINVVISEYTKYVSDLNVILRKSGSSFSKSALSGFRLQKTKERLKELMKIQTKQINDSFEREIKSANDTFTFKQKKFKDEEKLMRANLKSIETISEKSSRRQRIADIKANKNNYKVLREMDAEEFERLITKKKANNKEIQKILDSMAEEEQEKLRINLEIQEEIIGEHENEILKIKIENNKKMADIELDHQEQNLRNRNEDFINLIANQDAELEHFKAVNDAKRDNLKALRDANLITEEEYQMQLATIKQDEVDFDRQQYQEKLEAFKELYTQMSDVVLSVSKNIADANMNRIQEEHEQRTADLNNQFEEELEIADQAGADTVAMKRAHDNKMESLEEQKEEKLLAIKKRQFNIDKANSVAMALINGAQAISKVTAQTGIGAIAAAPITAGLIAVQVGAILAQKFVGQKGGIIPGAEDKFADGGMVMGPSHANGGVKFNAGGRVVELEGGEAVINKRSTAMFRGQLSAMNVAGGGKAFAQGGVTPGTRAALDAAKGTLNVSDVAQLITSSINSQQVYVTESDISSTQTTVSITENNSNIF